jgi:rsbT co-antagonist protein RsbR
MSDQEKAVDGNGGNRFGDGIEVTEEELAHRKQFLELGDADVNRLTGINDLARRYADTVIEDFYRHLMLFEDTRSFFGEPQVLQRVKNMQKEYFLRLTQGNYDLGYRCWARSWLSGGRDGGRLSA